jgi:hypothetical protein
MRAGKGPSVKLGRKLKLTEHQKPEAIRRRDRDSEPVREIARSYDVSHNTFEARIVKPNYGQLHATAKRKGKLCKTRASVISDTRAKEEP